MTSRSCTFYIVRHGETEWNAKKIVQGQTDIPLNATGKEQAKKAASLLKNIQFDLVFSSDLLRAKDTATVIAAEHNLEVVVTKLLREREFGELEGKHFSALKAYNEYFRKLSKEDKFKSTAHGVESDEQIISRLMIFFQKIVMMHPGKTILIATHGGTMRTLLIHVGFGDHNTLQRGAIANTAIVKLITDGKDFFIEDTTGIKKEKV